MKRTEVMVVSAQREDNMGMFLAIVKLCIYLGAGAVAVSYLWDIKKLDTRDVLVQGFSVLVMLGIISAGDSLVNVNIKEVSTEKQRE